MYNDNNPIYNIYNMDELNRLLYIIKAWWFHCWFKFFPEEKEQDQTVENEGKEFPLPFPSYLLGEGVLGMIGAIGGFAGMAEQQRRVQGMEEQIEREKHFRRALEFSANNGGFVPINLRKGKRLRDVIPYKDINNIWYTKQ